jgi:hypothetical protein
MPPNLPDDDRNNTADVTSFDKNPTTFFILDLDMNPWGDFDWKGETKYPWGDKEWEELSGLQ